MGVGVTEHEAAAVDVHHSRQRSRHPERPYHPESDQVRWSDRGGMKPRYGSWLLDAAPLGLA
jgi:hypothetical protein